MAILRRIHNEASRSRERGGRRSEAVAFVLRFAIISVVSLALTLALSSTATAQRGAKINRLKAAFLYQFTNFVEWPDDAFEDEKAPFTICIVGNDELKDALETAVRSKFIAGRTPIVQSHSSSSDLSSCQIVFVDESERRRASDIVDRYMDRPILTVGDSDDFTKVGGIIRLYQQGSKLRIEINIDAAKRAGLKISSKLLSLGRVVHYP